MPMPSPMASLDPSLPVAAAPPTGQADGLQPLLVTPDDVDRMMLYLLKARERAEKIRENAPAGSYLDSVLRRTIDGLGQELAHLRYLLGHKDIALPVRQGENGTRMRAAL